MALTQSLTQLEDAIRRMAGAEGADALVRHSQANVFDAANRGLASLHRILTKTRGEQRALTLQTVTTVAGTSGYALGATAMTVISVEGSLDGARVNLTAFQPDEYATLADEDAAHGNYPTRYAIRGATDIVFLPVPQAVYSINVWFVPAPTTLASGSDTFDTIARLDDYVVMYAAKILAVKDKAWDLVKSLNDDMKMFREDIENVARQRDQASVGRMTNVYNFSRSGRRR